MITRCTYCGRDLGPAALSQPGSEDACDECRKTRNLPPRPAAPKPE